MTASDSAFWRKASNKKSMNINTERFRESIASQENDLAGHKVTCGLHKKVDDLDHIPRLTIALDCLARDQCIELLGWHATDEIGPDRRGADRVYGDAEVRELARQNLGEGNHG